MKRIIVTGGAGFIGSNVCDGLLSDGNAVLSVDNYSTGRTSNLEDFALMGGKVCELDIRDLSRLRQVFHEFKPDYVVHLAAQASISESLCNPVHDATVNILGTLNVINACREYQVKRLIFSSTSAVYSEASTTLHETSPVQPASPYGVSKAAAEMYIRQYLSDYVIFRFANIYGPRQRPIGSNQLIARVIRHLKFGDKFEVVGTGAQKRDYLYVGDVLDGIRNAISDGMRGTFNLAYSTSYSVNDVLRLVEEVFDLKSYCWKHTNINDTREVSKMTSNSVKLNFGWKPKTSLLEGIRNTKLWWDQYND